MKCLVGHVKTFAMLNANCDDLCKNRLDPDEMPRDTASLQDPNCCHRDYFSKIKKYLNFEHFEEIAFSGR